MRVHETRFTPLSLVVRHRLLPVAGEVLVRVGDRVEAHDVVARAPIEGQLYALDLAQALGVSVEAVPRCLQVAEGQTVEAGTTLARVRRLFGSRQVKAPIQATVQGIADGRVFLRQPSQMLELLAYLPGEVAEAYPHRGVAIRTAGALIRGIWGSGGEGQGIIATMVAHPQEILTWERIGLRYRGTVVVGGILEDPRVLLRARQFRLHGLIVGSITPNLRPLCERLGLPVIVTEGIGHIPMASPIFQLLHAYHGRTVVLSGSGRDGHSGPEAIVPIQAQPDAQTSALTIVRPIQMGALVRLTRPPYLGGIAQVVALPPTPQETAIGTRAEGAEVRLPDGLRVFVPFVNLELLE